MNYAPDLTTAAFKMVFSLALVLSIVWGLYRIARKKLPLTRGGGSGNLIQVLDSHYLGVKKNITMVQVPGSVLVLGITADKVNLLTQIEDPALIKSITSGVENKHSVLSFRGHLQRLTQPKRDQSKSGNQEAVVE